MAQVLSRPTTDFLSGVALQMWQPPHVRQYARQRDYFLNKSKARAKTAVGRKEKTYRSAVYRAQLAGWNPLVDALKAARANVAKDADVDCAQVYKDCGLVWMAKCQKTVLWCEWKPKRSKSLKPHGYRRQKDNEWRRRKWASDPEYRRKEYLKKARRKQRDPHYRLRVRLATRIGDAVRSANARKYSKTEELIGCTYKELRAHLQSQFTRGMAWNNYGKWHVDHIVPCASFDLTKPEEQRRCFNWRNLQPLWAADNIRKGDKVPHVTPALGL
jgi:hypothetical protein